MLRGIDLQEFDTVNIIRALANGILLYTTLQNTRQCHKIIMV